MIRQNKPTRAATLAANISTYATCSGKTTSTASKIRPVIDEIFVRLAEHFKARFYSGYSPGQDGVREIQLEKIKWTMGDLKFYTDSEIRKALTRCENECKWPPNLAEFLHLVEVCAGVKTIDQAYTEACTKRLHELDDPTRWAAMKTGKFELSHLKATQIKPTFAENYREALRKIRLGEKPPVLLEDRAEDIKTGDAETKKALLSDKDEKPQADENTARSFIDKLKNDLEQ